MEKTQVRVHTRVRTASGHVTDCSADSLTHGIPIIFPVVGDPIGAGYVDSLARPGSNVTGFMTFEFSQSGKWVELLKEIAPTVTRVAVLRDLANTATVAQFGAIQAVGPTLGLEVIPINLREAGEIEQSMKRFASFSEWGSGRSGERRGDTLPRSDCHVVGQIQAAGRLSISFLCH